MEKPKRRETQRGLGVGGTLPPSAAKRSGVRERGERDADEASSDDAPISGISRGVTVPAPARASEPPVSERRAASGGPARRARTSRPPIRVDDVGDAAVALARKAVWAVTPKVLKSGDELASLPIDHRDAFVLSLIDGRMSVHALVDVAGMPEPEVAAILEKLTRLGIVGAT